MSPMSHGTEARRLCEVNVLGVRGPGSPIQGLFQRRGGALTM